MRIVILIAASLLAVASWLYAFNRNAALKQAEVKIAVLSDAQRAALEEREKEREKLEQELYDTKAFLVKTLNSIPPENPAIPPEKHADQVALYTLEPETTVGERGKKSYYFKHLVGSGGQLLASNSHFRELLGLSKFSFKTPDGIRYFDVNDLHPSVVSSLGFDVSVINRRIVEDNQQQHIRSSQIKFQQDMRAKAAIENAAHARTLFEQSRAESAMREATAKERLADIAQVNAANQQRPPEVNVKVINVPNQY
ncbi:MAG: hypothetical protein H8M99_06990 [Gloeobacteraceae cyanobacterium ES-bin-144]|nr:hypothetical protein [Verrucomicrobiales bacterium]